MATPFAEDGTQEPTGVGKGLQSGTVSSRAWESFDFEPYKHHPSTGERLLSFYMMQAFDSTIGSCLYIIRRMVANSLGRYTHEDEGVANMVNEALNQVEGGLSQTVQRMLSAIWAGVSVSEVVWEGNESAWYPNRVELLHPLTFARELYVGTTTFGADSEEPIALDEETGRVERVLQYTGDQQNPTNELSIDNLLYWPYDAQFREQTYGHSALERARRSWYAKTKLEQYWNVYLEKFASPVPMAVVPPGHTKREQDGKQIPNAEFYSDFLTDLVAGQGIAIEAGESSEVSLDYLQPDRGASSDYNTATGYWDSQMFTAVLFPRPVLQEAKYGTRAQTDSMLKFFLMLLEGIREELERVLVFQLCARIVQYNVGPEVDAGAWEWESLQTEDMEVVASVLEKFMNAQARGAQAGVGLSKADEDKLRTGPLSGILADPSELSDEAQQMAASRGREEADEMFEKYGGL